MAVAIIGAIAGLLNVLVPVMRQESGVSAIALKVGIAHPTSHNHPDFISAIAVLVIDAMALSVALGKW